MKFFINARYLIVPISSLITIFGIFIGSTYAWTGVILFGLYTIIDTLTKDIHLKAEIDDDGNSYGIKIFQYLVMYVMLPVFITIQIILAWRIYQYTSGVVLQNLSLGSIEYQNGISGINLIGL